MHILSTKKQFDLRSLLHVLPHGFMYAETCCLIPLKQLAFAAKIREDVILTAISSLSFLLCTNALFKLLIFLLPRWRSKRMLSTSYAPSDHISSTGREKSDHAGAFPSKHLIQINIKEIHHEVQFDLHSECICKGDKLKRFSIAICPTMIMRL